MSDLHDKMTESQQVSFIFRYFPDFLINSLLLTLFEILSFLSTSE